MPEDIYKITKDKVKKIIELASCGFTYGLGQRKKGQMCVEAAVCYAMGEEEHHDYPECVDSRIADLKISLNDANWSSRKARGDGLVALAIAQLGAGSKYYPKFIAAYERNFIREVFPWVISTFAKNFKNISMSLGLSGYIEDFLSNYDSISTISYNNVLLKKAYYDEFLLRVADAALDALKECKSPGVKYLSLLPASKMPKALIKAEIQKRKK